MPLPVMASERSLEQHLATSRVVMNTVPVALVEQTAQAVEAVDAAAGAGR
jgi:hypothetical protein